MLEGDAKEVEKYKSSTKMYETCRKSLEAIRM